MCRVTQQATGLFKVKDPAFGEKPVERKNASGLYKWRILRGPEIRFWGGYDWSVS
jgi:hypothetical protein